MGKRFATLIVLALLGAGSASGQGSDERRQAIQDKIASLREKIRAAEQREGVLTTEISAVTARIRTLEGEVGDATTRLVTLENELKVYARRLGTVTALLDVQTRKLKLMRGQHAIAQGRLNERLVAIYESNDPSSMEIVLAARNFTDLLDQLDYQREIGRQDRRIADRVARAKREIAEARARTERTRASIAEAARAIAVREARQRGERDRLVAGQQALASARSEKRRTLAGVRDTREEFLREVQGLERASAAIAARIRAAQSVQVDPSRSYDTSAGPGGMFWPVSGTVTSPFGWRWGRMHEGLDIAAPSGVPIQASASGVVIYAGWMGGYGNFVVIDHGRGVATAYAHQSSVAVAVGQQVGQGQTIGYIGCTGSCTGPHVHFEVRVNGAAVDPLGYL